MATPVNGGPVMAEDNIINRRGGESLYQICVNLKRRLVMVPGFEQHLEEMEADEKATDSDPVAAMWRFLQRGIPLMTLYNASQPEVFLTVDDATIQSGKAGKKATFKFLQACMSEMQFPAAECFLIVDLYNDSTTGFVKVTKMVNKVLDMLELQGRLQRIDTSVQRNGAPGGKLTQRQHILKELLDTERDYVHHLQNLLALKKELEETGALSGDSIHSIFLNLNNLLDFAQRFLIKMEGHNALPEAQQNWGLMFTSYQEGLRQYEPFIANQMHCDAVCQKEWDKIQAAPRSPDLLQMVAVQSTLNGFFMKPFQRLTKYPLILQSLQKTTEDAELKADLAAAIEVIQGVLDQANVSVNHEALVQARADLDVRVDDWKLLKMDKFGDLLRYGTFTVLKGDGGKDTEREYHIYLFERILLCCKDINPNKQKSKLIGGKEKIPVSAKGKPRLQLKGRIFMANVTDIICLQKPGSYTIQIFWKGDPGVENFVIKFQNDDLMRKWYKDIDDQRANRVNEAQRNVRATGTSDSEFTSLMGSNLTNPYAQPDEFDDYDTLRESGGPSDFSMSRNASSTSLRSRSATGGSGGSMSQQTNGRPPPRFPMDGIPLTVHTSFTPGPVSPGDRGGNSYFSPGAESPVSTRSSSQSNFGRHTPGGWNEDTSRHTAPAMSRNPARESNSTNSYIGSGAPGRSQRPSLPVIAGPHAQPMPINQSRLRSASSPDIHNPLMHAARRYQAQQAENVPVPPIPAHMANMRGPLNRSQSNSPTNGFPMRTPTGSSLPRHPAQHLYEHHHQQAPQQQYPPRSDPRTQQPPMLTPSTSSSHLSSMDSALSPPLSENGHESLIPSQLKAKVNFEDNYVTLVVASNIHFRSLIDRVDAKLSRFTSRSIGGKSVRLRYRDEDGDFITIDSDEAVQMAFLEWRDQHQNMLAAGQVGEIQLYCQTVD